MAEQPATSERPPIHRVVRGSVLKGRTVTTPYATIEDLQALEQAPHPADRQVAVRDVETATEATIRLANLERTFRTPKERDLGRDFTPEEAAAYEHEWELRFTRVNEQHTREAIAYSIEQIVGRIEQAVEDIRRELGSDRSDPAQKAQRVQNTILWLTPNLNLDGLTRQAIEWTTASGDLKRLDTRATPDVDA